MGGHAYTILDIKQKFGDDDETIVQIRNPWGSFEWHGKWSDEDDAWTDELREECGVVKKDDGTFWMAINDMTKFFEDLHIGEVNNDYQLSSCTVNGARNTVQFDVNEYTTELTLTISQTDKRFFSPDTSYKYSPV